MTPRRQLAFLHAAHFTCHYFLLIFPIAVIAIEHDWSLPYGAALALGTPVYVFFAIGTLPAGWLGDRWDAERLIGLSFLGCGCASVFVAFAPDDLWLMAGLGVMGLFASIYHPVGLSMVTKLTDRPGRALAVNGVFGNLGLAAASLATGLLADTFGWRSAFLVPGVVAVGIGVAHFLARRRSSATVDALSERSVVSSLAPSRSVQMRVVGVVMLAALFGGFVFNGVSISMPKLLDERLGEIASGLASVGGYSALVFAVAAFAQLPVGALLDRIGGRSVMLVLLPLMGGALAVMSQASGALVVPSALAAVTLMFAALPITAWLLGRYVAASWRSRAFAVEYVLSLGMSAVVVPMMAVLHEWGYGFDWQYVFFALSAGVVVFGAFVLPKPARSERPTGTRIRV